MRIGGAILFALFGLVQAASGLERGTLGHWTRITEPTGRNVDQVALVRTKDGVVHVAWTEERPGSKATLWHQGIRANGSVAGAKNSIVTGFNALGNPDLVVAPDGGLRVFFGGLGTAPNNALNTATAPASGAAWTLQPGNAAQDTSAYASASGAGTTTDGTPVAAWGTTFGTRAHVGVDPATADLTLQTACCGYYPDVATADAPGQAVVGWFSNATKDAGLYTQTISAAGPVGPRLYVPGSATADHASTLGIDQRMAITRRVGGGVYVAYGAGYPTFKSVNLWRNGAAKPVFSIPAAGAQDVNISAAPDGRVWLMWQRQGTISVTRTNKAATKAGPVVAVKAPPGTTSIWKVSGEGSLGQLELFANVTTPGSTATWHTQVRAMLSLAASGGKVLRFVVTDAGDPVAGAKIAVAGRTLTTSSGGRAQVDLPKGTFTAVAAAPGYAPSATVKVGSS
jgi:hypothetical protein